MNSATFPILCTDRLTLRQLTLDDQQDIFDLRSDPEINKFLHRPICTTQQEALDFIRKINDNIEKGDTYYWAITLTGTKELVGTICLFDLSEKNSTCEIGYELMPDFQGQGIMKEAAQAVIDYVFQILKFHNIRAVTHDENERSTNLLLKFKFVQSTEMDKENPNLNVFLLTRYK